MPPPLATLVYLSVTVWLFRRDIREKPNVTLALWLPLTWFFLTVSRTLSEWVAILVGVNIGGSSMEEGSPVDALFSFALMVAGLRVLARRRVMLAQVLSQNRWLAIFFVYCFLAVFWSDFPFVAFKRWVKVMGHPIMVLVLLTEPDFEVALTVLMKRIAYIVVPVSILFIKYFPGLGRGFSEWTGQASNRGIAGGKNALGVDCLILGFFFVWYLLKVWQMEKGKPRWKELRLCGGLLFGLWWLLHMAQSSTALVSLMVGISLMLFMGLPMVRKENIGTWIVLIIVVLGVAEFVFGLSDAVFALLGRDKTLTDRVYVWRDCLSIPINPILGAGFESFWLGRRQEIMNEKWYWHPNEAHNGYLETYLTLGLLGLFILLALLFSTFWKCRRELITNFHFGRFRMGFLSALMVYNWTESSFKALHPMWFVFYIIALDYAKDAVVVPADPARVEVPPSSPGLEGGDEPEDSPPELAAFDR